MSSQNDADASNSVRYRVTVFMVTASPKEVSLKYCPVRIENLRVACAAVQGRARVCFSV